jgi:hypothetical protein
MGTASDVVLEKRGSRWYKRTKAGSLPLTPSEMRDLMTGGPAQWTEADLLRELVLRFRWTWVGKDCLRRYNPFGVDIRAAVAEETDATA